MDVQAEEEAEKEYDSDDDGTLEFVMEHNQKDQEVENPSDEEGEEETCGEHKQGSPRGKTIWNVSCFGKNDDAILWTLSGDTSNKKQANWGGMQ
eukprot:5770292-Ditylum_brightwellii.AAC.1